MKRMPGFASFILFAALCASAAFWFLQLWRPPVRAVAAPVAAAAVAVPMDVAAGLFGGRPVAVGVASNYQLRGVILAKNGRESVAILSADGKPAQAVGINTEFQPGVTVKEVHPQYVLLSENGIVKRVALPDSARASGPDLTVPAMPMQSSTYVQPSTQPQPPPQSMQPVQPTQPMQPVQPTPQFQIPPQAANPAVQPVIGQMSNQLSQPVPGQVNAAGQPASPAGQPINPGAMSPNLSVPAGGSGSSAQQRRQ